MLANATAPDGRRSITFDLHLHGSAFGTVRNVLEKKISPIQNLFNVLRIDSFKHV